MFINKIIMIIIKVSKFFLDDDQYFDGLMQQLLRIENIYYF